MNVVMKSSSAIILLCIIYGCTTNTPNASTSEPYDLLDTDGLIKTDRIVWEAKHLEGFESGTVIEIVTNGVSNKVFKIVSQPLRNAPIGSDALSKPRVTTADGREAIISVVCSYFWAHNIDEGGSRAPVIGAQYYYPFSVKDDKTP